MPPSDTTKRGRPADYCGRSCRQAAYRKRQRQRSRSGAEAASQAASLQSPEQLQLLELAHDTQEEMRHLVRLLSNSHHASAVDILEYSVQVQRRMETVTAGVVLMARRRRIPWEVLGKALNISPETARHSYHEHHIQRRLNLHTTVPAPAQDLASAADEDDGPAPPQQPSRPSLRATNQLAPVLSRLQKASGIPLRKLSLRTQVSASYLSRVLTGERFPTLELTEKIALALGADSEAVRKVWHDERARNGTRPRPRSKQSPAPEPEAGPSLPAALRTLHQRAACPTPHSLSVATRHLVSSDDVRRFLHGEALGSWEQVAALIRAMDGEPSFFRSHWEEAQQTTHVSTPQPATTPTHSLNQLLTTFGDVLDDARALATSPALIARRRALRRRLAAGRSMH